ncbi:MAG: hypothetical protein P8Y66_08795 [Nitrospirota bacterium]
MNFCTTFAGDASSGCSAPEAVACALRRHKASRSRKTARDV